MSITTDDLSEWSPSQVRANNIMFAVCEWVHARMRAYVYAALLQVFDNAVPFGN